MGAGGALFGGSLPGADAGNAGAAAGACFKHGEHISMGQLNIVISLSNSVGISTVSCNSTTSLFTILNIFVKSP